MEEYKLEFEFPHINVSTLKEKDCNKLLLSIGGSRHVKNIWLNGYGELKFDNDDNMHYYPTFIPSEKFNRLKTNCMEFGINVNGGDGKYDRLFLYHTKGNHINNYGYVMYNTKTGKQKHKYFVYDNLADIVQHINKELNAILWHTFPGDIRGHHDYDMNVNFATGLLKKNDRFVIMYPDLPSYTYRPVKKNIINT